MAEVERTVVGITYAATALWRPTLFANGLFCILKSVYILPSPVQEYKSTQNCFSSFLEYILLTCVLQTVRVTICPTNNKSNTYNLVLLNMNSKLYPLNIEIKECFKSSANSPYIPLICILKLNNFLIRHLIKF